MESSKTIELAPELDAALTEAADELNVTREQLLADALREYLDSHTEDELTGAGGEMAAKR